MKDFLKIINKKQMIKVFIFGIISYVSVYGISFCISYYLQSPITISKLYMLLFSLILLYIISLVSNWIYNHYYENFIWSTQYKMRNYYFMKVLELDPKNIVNYHSSYISRTIYMSASSLVVVLELILNSILPLTIGVVSYLIMAFSKSWIMALISIIIFILSFFIRYKMRSGRVKYTNEMFKVAGEYDSIFDDFIQNMFTIIRLHCNKFVLDKLDSRLDKFVDATQIDEDKKANEKTVFNLLTNFLYILVIITSLKMFNDGEDVISYIVFFFTILGTIIAKIESTSLAFNSIFEYKIHKNKMNEIIGEKKNKKYVNKWDNIRIENGLFRYKERNFDIRIPLFEFNKNDKICITGESGQGKTTILNILSDLYELNSGNIIVDNKDIDNKKLKVIFISQDFILFDLSVRDNLTLGKNIPDDNIISLLEEAGLKEWYNSLENGLDEIVGQKGNKLSAGQQQRLNIIRGILIDNDIYFFDEPTSNLDKDSEERIVNMIKNHLKDKSMIIISHRDKIKEICNKFYVMEEHTIKEVK